MAQTQSRYVRPNLQATSTGQIDPSVEVELRLNEVDDVLAGREPASEPLRAYCALALWGWFRRIDPELVGCLDHDGVVGKLNKYVEDNGRDLALLSDDIWDSIQWLEGAKQLAASWEEVMPGEERAKMSDELISELDDTDLWCYAACRLGIPKHILSVVAACNRWLRENAAEFLAASWYVQAVAAAFRTDLDVFDTNLSKTADKFTAILDEAEKAERWLHTPVRDRVPPQLIRQLRALRDQSKS